MSILNEMIEGAGEEFGSLFRLGSKKYYDQYYIEQKKKRERASWDEPKPKIRQIEPYAVYLRSLRLKAGLKQQTMASLMKTKQSAISRFEGGWTKPTTSFLERYAQTVGAELTLLVRPKTKSQAEEPSKKS